MNDAEKKREVATFVLTEHNIKKAEVRQELLKNQFLEAVPMDYYLKLNAGVLCYNGSTVCNLLTLHNCADFFSESFITAAKVG